jgi:Domain of unknown function (DUF4389)
MSMSADAYPVRVEASLDPRLSRWLWLVKWFLAIPHYVVLAVLWVAFVVLSIGAFFAILFTGRYPRAIFDFNVGVLRWTWRVQYYTYGTLGTDRYPPFTLEERPDYPAHLAIEFPGRLSRGLVLVKWWLLAIPQYLVVGLFAGGAWAAWQLDGHQVAWGGGGLIGLLVLFAAIMLAVTGRYPSSLFDLILGLNRWVLRVAAYAALMTDQYPPFRLDLGGSEPDARLSVPPPSSPPPPRAASPGWTAGRIVSVVIGSVLVLVSAGLLAGGGAVVWAGQSQRQDGYLTSATGSYSTRGYALTSETVSLQTGGSDWISRVIGTVRIRVTATGGARPVFVGIAPAAAAGRYLAGVSYTTVTDFGTPARTTAHLGTGTPAPPQSAGIWAARAAGPGTQVLTWTPRAGDWTVVVLNRDTAPGVAVRADAGATFPALPWVAAGLLAGGVLLGAAGVLLIVVPVRRVSVGSRAAD